MYDVLKDTGSFYLHCDWHASHYLKVMLDGIFGHHNFRNEIVWCYTRPGTKYQRQFPRVHDNILYYSKGAEWTFNVNEIRIQYAESTINRGEYSIATSKVTKGIEKRVLPKGGKCPEDWWKIPMIQGNARERLGYPTQKPETLLERIIKASSNKSNLILDPFCGCGTAMAVAQRLGRRWIGIDISPTAISLIEKRLDKLGAVKSKDFDSIGMPTTLSELKALEPFEFQNWAINEMRAKHSKKLVGDMGLNGHYDKTIFTDSAGIQVKQSEKVGRNVVFNFETALRAGKYEKGYIAAFSFTKGTHEEAARAKGEALDIKLIKVEDLLLGKVKI